MFLLNPAKTKLVISILLPIAFLLVIIVVAVNYTKKRKINPLTIKNDKKKIHSRKKITVTEKSYLMDGDAIFDKSSNGHGRSPKDSSNDFTSKKEYMTEIRTSCDQHFAEINTKDHSLKGDSVPEQPQDGVWTIEFLKSIEWKRYEDLCVLFLKMKGYNASTTGLGADDGVDINIYAKDNPSQIYAIAQCKSYTSYNIGVKFIRELYGVMVDKNINIGIFFTTSTFTKDAKKFAEGKKIQLIDGHSLIEKINKLSANKRYELFSQITEGDYKTPSCPKCGIKMILRANRKNLKKKFWGCRNFPRCKTIIHCNSSEEKYL